MVLFQMILKASSGIDYKMFYDLLNTIGKKRLDILHKMKREHMSDTEKESYRLRKGDPSEGPGNHNAALDQFDDVDKLLGNSGLEFDDVNKHSENDIPCIGRRKEELCKLTSLNSETQKGDQTRNRFSDPETTKSKYLSPEMPGDRDHIMFDLYRIKEVLQDIMNDTDFKLLNIEQCSSSLFDLQFEID